MVPKIASWAVLVLSMSPLAWSSGVPTPMSSSPGSISAITKRLNELARSDNRTFTNSTTLDTSFNDAVLFKVATSTDLSKSDSNATITATNGISIVCNTCYIAGHATARLMLAEDLNITKTLDSVEDSISTVISNITEWVDNIEVDWDDANIEIPPPPEIDFNIELPDMPEAVLEFEFENTEIYLEMNTIFSSGVSYKLPLYITQSPLGVQLGDDFFLGLVFSLDLILSLDSSLEIQHGFHIKLDKTALLRISMFSKEATELKFNGGQFEFLPVEVVAGGTVLRAVLQLSLRAGFAITTDLIPGPEVELGPFSTEDFVATAGLETRIYANLADFKTNITLPDPDDEEEDCDFRVEQAFQFAVGAAVGAYVGIGDKTWGPMPETEVPLFPTTFLAECVTLAAALPGSTASLEARRAQDDDDELTTTTLEKEITYTAIECSETSAINCPAHKEVYREHVTTETHVTAVASGVEPTWPETITAAAVSTKSFGTDSHPITTSSGKPTADKPKTEGQDDDEISGVNTKLIIGLSVGLGALALIALIAGIFLWRRKSAKRMAPYHDTTYVTVVTETVEPK